MVCVCVWQKPKRCAQKCLSEQYCCYIARIGQTQIRQKLRIEQGSITTCTARGVCALYVAHARACPNSTKAADRARFRYHAHRMWGLCAVCSTRSRVIEFARSRGSHKAPLPPARHANSVCPRCMRGPCLVKINRKHVHHVAAGFRLVTCWRPPFFNFET